MTDILLLDELNAINKEVDEEPNYSGKSTVLCQIIEGDSPYFSKWEKGVGQVNVGLEFGEIQYTEGTATYEDDHGAGVDYAIAPMLEDGFWKVGWFVIEGFDSHYSQDFYGEWDANFDCDFIRPARWSDIEKFGLIKAPWWMKLARLVGIDPLVKPDAFPYEG